MDTTGPVSQHTSADRNGTLHPSAGAVATRHVPPPVLLAELLDDLEREAAAAELARTTGAARGPVTGLKSLDQVLGGVREPGLHVAHGGPGSGKTAWVLQEAASCGCPALLVSCEMRGVELLRRHTARVTQTPLGDLKSGALPAERVRSLAELAARAAPWLALLDATMGSPSTGILYQHAVALQERARSHGASGAHILVVVDSAHAWAAGRLELGDTEYERLSAGLDELRGLAAQLRAPVLVVAERNRLSMDNGGLNAAAGTRRFEYGAESVVGLARVTGKEAPMFSEADKKAVRITVEKNRNGDSDIAIKAVFYGRYQQFLDERW